MEYLVDLRAQDGVVTARVKLRVITASTRKTYCRSCENSKQQNGNTIRRRSS